MCQPSTILRLRRYRQMGPVFDFPKWNLSENDFEFFQKLIFKLSGISLSAKKRVLVVCRLRSYIENLGLNSFCDYRHFLEKLPDGHIELQKFINLLTTNKTDFFREPQHFDFIVRKFLPEWLEKKNNTLKIWSCASSSGEEPYTLAMVLAEHLPQNRNFEILATDLDTSILNAAKNAVYSIAKHNEIPDLYRDKYTETGSGSISDWFRIKPFLKNKVHFSQHNLIDEHTPSNANYDLILCRNVLIYFSPSTVERVIRKLKKGCEKNGTLIVGSSEWLQGESKNWQMVEPSIFKNK